MRIFMSGFAKRLNEAVGSSGLSASEIEEKLALPEGSIDKWIGGDGEPDTPTVNALAELLKTSANYLLFGAKNMGEIKAMFPNDAHPAPTPVTDWRFLSGVILVFIGAVGVLMMVMRYGASGLSVPALIASLGAPLYAFGAMFVLGVIICVVTCVVTLSTKKIRKKKKNEKKR